MSDLNNLISKIINDSEEESKKITEAAEKQAAGIVGEAVAAAEKDKARILEAASSEAQKSAEQVVMGKKLEIRDEHLNAKRQVVDKVFGIVLEKLNNMHKEDFWRFLCNQLPAHDTDGWEIILPSKYGYKDASEINAFLEKNGRPAKLTLNGSRDVDGGFILIKEGIESNNTFKVLVDYYRYGLESEITAKLF